MPKNTMSGRLVAYYRYSGGSGQTDQSIEGQRRDCEAWARSHGLSIDYEYIDRHISGKTDNRAAFQRMIEDSDRHAFDMLICWKTDRLARNRYDSAVYKSRLRKNGVKIIYAAESSVEGPEGIILEGLMESLAEYYSAELSQKLRRGRRESAIKCHSLGGYPVLGLKTNKNHEYEIDEKRAPTVRWIFEQYASGRAAASIVDELNARGVRSAAGGPFNKNSILRIVTNEKYIGTYTSRAHNVRVENAIPAIIDRELWEKVQRMVTYHRAGRCIHSKSADYILSGKLYCGLCNSTMKGISGTSKQGTKHYYYTCTAHTEHRCAKRNISKTYLEDLIVSATAEYVLDPVKLDQIVDRILSLQQRSEPQSRPEVSMLEAELAENTRKQDNILNAIEDGTASARLTSRLQELESQAADLRRRLADMEPPPPAPVFDRDQLLFMLEQFRRAPDEQDDDYKRRLVDTFIHAVYLTDDSAFVQFNISSPVNDKSTTLESVVLDLLHGDPDENIDVPTSKIMGFDHVALGGPVAAPDEPFHSTVLVSTSCILLCIQNISRSTRT